MHAHRASGDVDGTGRRQKRAAGLRIQIAVGTFNVPFREGISSGAIQAHGVRRSRHSTVSYTRGAGKSQQLIIRSIAGVVAPSFAFAVHVDHVSLLHEGVDAVAGLEGGVEDTASADAIWLTGILTDDARVGRAVNRSELTGVVKVSVKFRRRSYSLCSGAGGGANDNLRGARGFGSVEMALLVGHEKVDARGAQLQILRAGGRVCGSLMLRQHYVVFGMNFG